MERLSIGIAGAGLLGRLLAWRLSHDGHRVAVFDPAVGPEPTFDGQQAAGFSAAGMLSPLAELDNAGPEVAALGWRSIAMWRDIVARLPGPPMFAERGSLLLAHRSDLGAAQRVLARIAEAPADAGVPQQLDAPRLAAIEPALQGAAYAWLLPREAQIDPVATMLALHADALRVVWHWGRSVDRVGAGQLALAGGSLRRFDVVFDVRGVGARPVAIASVGDEPTRRPPGEAAPRRASLARAADPLHGIADATVLGRPDANSREARAGSPGADTGFTSQVRGVRGEIVWLHAPGHGLTRPVRLLHPRHRVYLVPRPGDVVVVGASEIESEDRGPVSLRSAVELMAAAHSVMPALAEARILQLDRNLRPALADNEPRIEHGEGRVRINGLFRHGWLLAPALVEDALAGCGLGRHVMRAEATA